MSESYTTALLNKILLDYQKGEKESSFKKLEEFVTKNPSNETAIYNFGYMCSEFNYTDLAVKNYYKVLKINPKHWQSKFNLYLIFINKKDYMTALKLVNDVLKIKTNYQPALRDKAVILYYLKKADEALPIIKESLKQNPQDYIALNTMGLICMEMKNFELSKQNFEKAISINPSYYPSYNNLGRLFSLRNNKNSAYKYFKKALEINPNFQEAINNLANHYSETGYYQKAIDTYLNALEKNKNNFEILYNIAIAYLYLKNYKKSEEYYKKSFEINTTDEKLIKNYAFLLLALQKYKEGWINFESRLGLEEFKLKNDFINNTKHKIWDGSEIKSDNKILLIKEQGVGDEILYGSMYPDFIKKYKKIQIETDPRLISLFERSFNIKDVFVPYTTYSKNKKNVDQFNHVIYAGSLGRLFRNKISDFPKAKFLIVKESKFKEINKIIGKLNTKIKIGISWKSKNETYGVDKSLNLDLLLPILKLEEFSFINLQYGDTANEIKNFYNNHKLKILNIKEVDLFNDFEAIAALLKNLDLLITVSNSTAHLAGSLGVHTWLIKPKNHVTLHYWNQPGNTTPWYSSIKLFSYKNAWEETIMDIKNELLKKFI